MALQVGELFASITGDDSSINNVIQGVENNMNGLASRIGQVGQSLTAAGTQLTKRVTAPIAAFGALSTKTFAGFNDGMREVAALSGSTGDELQMLTDQAKNLGATTRFSASEAAEGMKFLALAGFDTAEIMETMPGILNLAAASGENLALVSDIVSDSLGSFRLEAGDASMIADVLAKASSSANTSVAQLGDAFRFVAPNAAEFGASAQETSAILGIMADSGIKASMAGTTLRQAFLRLADPPKEAAEALEELDIVTTDLDGNMLPLHNIIGQLENRFDGLSKSGRIQAASAIFGTTAVSGMLTVIEEGEQGIVDFTKELENSAGAAEEMAEIMEGGVGGALRELRSAFEGVLITIGEKLAPMIERAADRINSLLTAFINLSPEIQDFIIAVAGIAAVVGPAILIIGTILTKLSALITLFSGAAAGSGIFATVLGALTGPIGIVIAAIAGLVLVFKNLFNTNTEFREHFLEIWNSIKSSFTAIIEAVKEIAMVIFNELTEFWDRWGETILGLFSQVFKLIGNVFKVTFEAISLIFSIFAEIFSQDWEGLWDRILEFITLIWDTIYSFLDELLKSILKLFGVDLDSLENNVGDVFTRVKSTIEGIWIEIKEFFTGILDAIKNIFSTIFTGIKNTISRILNIIKKNIETVWNAISSFFSTIFSVITTIFGYAWEGLKIIVETFLKLMEKSIEFYWNLFSKIIETVLGIISKIVETTWHTIKTFTETIFGIMSTIIEGAWDIIQGIFDTALKAIEKITGIKFGDITSLFDEFERIVTGIFESTKKNVLKIWNSLSDAIIGAVNNLISSIEGLFETIGSFSRNVGRAVSRVVTGGSDRASQSTSRTLGVSSAEDLAEDRSFGRFSQNINNYNNNISIQSSSPIDTFNAIRNIDIDLRTSPGGL